MTVRCKLQMLLCMLLFCAIVFTSTVCASSPPALTLSDPNEQNIAENIEVENGLMENKATLHKVTQLSHNETQEQERRCLKK